MDISGISGIDLQKQVALQNTQKSSEDFSEVLKKASESQDDEKLKSACQQLEAYMLSMVYKQMKSSMLTGESLIEKGDYETTFEDYLIEARCDEMAKAGGIGLADAMYKQIKMVYASNSDASQQTSERASVIDEAL